nr:hypothetical protein [Candidatus Sigynarchaeota archaeon]
MDPSTWGLPPYISSPQNYVAGMIIELSTCFVSISLVLRAIAKYKEKKNRITVQIIFVFCGFFLGSLLTALGKVLVVSGLAVYDTVVYELFLDSLAIMALMISNTAFFLFTIEVFYNMEPGRRKKSIMIFVSIEIAIAIVGLFVLLLKIRSTVLKNVLSGGILAQSVFTYILLSIKAFKISRKATGLDKIGIQLVGLAGVLVITFFVFFALDVLNLFGWGNMSLFYFISWAIASAGIIVTYMGYFRPTWLLRRVPAQKS